MSLTTNRLSLPLLAAAQAQKEVTHNEALALLDGAVQAVVAAVAPVTVPASPAPGQCWIVGTGATGVWAGHDGALAIWTSGGWRFMPAFEGMQVWSIADAVPARREGTSWVIGALRGQSLAIAGQQVVGPRQSAVSAPSGGSVIDVESRAAIGAILGKMRAHGLIAP